MLRITTISSAKAAIEYYSRADYYLDDNAIPARWHGKTAEMLGLHGDVAFEQFAALCNNRHPKTGERLTRGHRANRRVGFGLTFSVSKSISILYASAGDDRILKAFRDSVDDTMRLLEQGAAVRVRKGGKNEDRQVGNMAYSDFIHTLARPTGEDRIPQPHLHTHVVAQNIAWDGEEDMFKALQLVAKSSAPYYQAVFRAPSEFSSLVTKLR